MSDFRFGFSDFAGARAIVFKSHLHITKEAIYVHHPYASRRSGAGDGRYRE